MTVIGTHTHTQTCSSTLISETRPSVWLSHRGATVNHFMGVLSRAGHPMGICDCVLERQGVYVRAHLFVITMQLVLDPGATRSLEPLPLILAAWPGSERTLTYESWVLSSLVSVYRAMRANPCRPLALHHSSLHVGQTEVNGLKGITSP